MTSALYPTYARADLAFESGEGAWLVANDGRRYLDFGAGVAVNSLGHGHPRLVDALQQASTRPWHVSNLYQIPRAERLARRLVEATFADEVFLCGTAAEVPMGVVTMTSTACAVPPGAGGLTAAICPSDTTSNCAA